MSRSPDAVDRFVAHLEQLAKEADRGTLARLRRGLGKPVGFATERDGWVRSRLPEDVPERFWDACALIASLFAMHPEPGGEGCLGVSFRQLMLSSAGGGPERRFIALVDSDEEVLPERLRHAVSLLRSKGIPVDWRQLLRDVQHWSHSDRFVQRAWTRAFWASSEAAEAPISTDTSITDVNS